MYHFKSFYRKRLENLFYALRDYLEDDSELGFSSPYGFLHFLFKAVSPLYSRSIYDYLKK